MTSIFVSMIGTMTSEADILTFSRLKNEVENRPSLIYSCPVHMRTLLKVASVFNSYRNGTEIEGAATDRSIHKGLFKDSLHLKFCTEMEERFETNLSLHIFLLF